MVKQIHAVEYYSAVKREHYSTLDTHSNIDEFPGNDAEWEKPNPKGDILYGSIYITSLKRQNHRNKEQMSGSQRLRGEKEVGVIIKMTTWGVLVMERAVSWLCP